MDARSVRPPKSRIKRIAVLLPLLLGLVVGLTRGHWWLRLPVARTTYEGRPAQATLWRSGDGVLLVALTSPEVADYIIQLHEQTVGSPNASEFIHLGPVAFTRNAPPLAVRIPSAKIPVQPKLTTAPGLVQFTDRARISILF